jgi:imidazolonepropionase-like amidohydrolase
MSDQIGRIKKDYLADFILVRGKPYEDIACLTAENILTTVKDGEPFGANQWPILNAGPGETVTLRQAKKSLDAFESQSAKDQVLLKAKSYQ